MTSLITAHIPPHGGFCATFDEDRYEAADVMARAHNLDIRPFGVKLEMVDPDTRAAIKWCRTEGWSTWVKE